MTKLLQKTLPWRGVRECVVVCVEVDTCLFGTDSAGKEGFESKGQTGSRGVHGTTAAEDIIDILSLLRNIAGG